MKTTISSHDNKAMGNRVKEARFKTGSTQEAFAATVGVSFRSWAAYERGERQIPNKQIDKIAKLLKVDAEWLLSGETALATNRLDPATLAKAKEIVDHTLTPGSDKYQVSNLVGLAYMMLKEHPSSPEALIMEVVDTVNINFTTPIPEEDLRVNYESIDSYNRKKALREIPD